VVSLRLIVAEALQTLFVARYLRQSVDKRRRSGEGFVSFVLCRVTFPVVVRESSFEERGFVVKIQVLARRPYLGV